MKKIRKSIFLCALVLTLMAGFYVPAAAVQTYQPDQITVLLNGSAVEFPDAAPYIQNNRTFVPFRAVFEALGAEVSYDGATQTITAVRDDTTVVFTIGQTSIDVTADGVTETIETDAAPFIDAAYSRTIVPVRFAAQAFGCTVGWDNDERTVLILDADGLMRGDTYTIMDKVLAYNQGLLEPGCSLSGTFDLSFTVNSDGALIPVVANGTVSALYGTSAVNMDLEMTIDLSDLLAYGGEIDEEAQEVLDQLQNISVEYILDLEDGIMYLKSPLLSLFLGIDIQGDYWISIDLSSYMSELGVGQDLSSLIYGESISFEEEVETALTSVTLTDVSDLEAAVESFEIIHSMFADSAFVQSGDTFTSSYAYSNEYGTAATAELSVTLQGEDATAFHFTLDVEDDIGSATYLSFGINESKNLTLQMTASESDMFEMELNMSFIFSNTTQEPDSEPEEGSVIISLG